MASIKDVAKRAQVGPATVSRVLNNTGYVSVETRKRVEMAIKELNYRPNELARNLFKKKAGIIAVLVPNTVHPFFSSFVGAVEEELYKKGYKTMLCNTVADSNAEHEYLDMLKRYIVDGIITDVHNLAITEYGDIDKPIVALDRYLSKNIPIVSSDHKKGGQMAAEELIKKGCKKVLHFFEEETYDAPFHDRHKEFDRIMKEHGVEVLNVQLDLNRFDTNYYAKEVRKVFDMDFNFDGIFAGDLPAIQCIKECLKRNKKVPEDVKIISYDGTYVTDLVVPELTSIVQPIQELARESVRIMTEMLNGNMDHPIHTVLPVSLRKGETT
jgi:LacI family transcriptional regulator, sucrose operon repressor